MIARAIPLAAIAVCYLTAGCENSLLDRSLVFFTNTTMGLEISVSPSDATAPVKLIIGYKRAEGVLNPVYHSQGVEAPATTDESEALSGGSSHTDKNASTSGSSSYSKKWSKSVPIAGGPKTVKRYRTEAYSVIAKIAGEVSGNAGDSAEGKLSVAQWFATGEAAKILAKQPGIAGAVTGSSAVAEAAAQQALGVSKLRGETRRTTRAIASLVHSALQDLKDTGDQRAAGILADLDDLRLLLPHAYPFSLYEWDETPHVLRVQDGRAEGDLVCRRNFRDFLDYWEELDRHARKPDQLLVAAIADDQLKLRVYDDSSPDEDADGEPMTPAPVESEAQPVEEVESEAQPAEETEPQETDEEKEKYIDIDVTGLMKKGLKADLEAIEKELNRIEKELAQTTVMRNALEYLSTFYGEL